METALHAFVYVHEPGNQASRRSSFAFWAAGVSLAAALSGCASSVSVQPDGTMVRHYLGYVRVVVPQAEADHPVYVSDVSTLGIRVSDGFSIGYLRDKQVVVPLDCRLVVLVATQKQLDDAVEKLSFFKGAPGFCAVVSPTLQSGDIP